MMGCRHTRSDWAKKLFVFYRRKETERDQWEKCRATAKSRLSHHPPTHYTSSGGIGRQSVIYDLIKGKEEAHLRASSHTCFSIAFWNINRSKKEGSNAYCMMRPTVPIPFCHTFWISESSVETYRTRHGRENHSPTFLSVSHSSH